MGHIIRTISNLLSPATIKVSKPLLPIGAPVLTCNSTVRAVKESIISNMSLKADVHALGKTGIDGFKIQEIYSILVNENRVWVVGGMLCN